MLDPWVLYPHPTPTAAAIRLFCFPYAGAGASIYRVWATPLLPHIEICAVQLPGRESRMREPRFTELTPLIDTLLPALLPHLDRPFAFFGHSMGALISYELAHRLRQRSLAGPSHLFVSARQAPSVPPIVPDIHHLPDAEFLAELRRYNGTPEAVLQNTDLMSFFLPILRADLALNAVCNPAPGQPLDCPISAFGGMQDTLVNAKGLAAWRDETSQSFQMRLLPGDHFFLKAQQAAVLEAIAQDLQPAFT